jgi:DNA-binding NarL/FixJ family response regulator
MQTIHDDEQKIFDSLKAGAHGYLTKDTKPLELIKAIEEAAAGGQPDDTWYCMQSNIAFSTTTPK